MNWISVKERLPKKDEAEYGYWIVSEYRGERSVEEAIYEKNIWHTPGCCDWQPISSKKIVTHWMAQPDWPALPEIKAERFSREKE